VHQGFRPDHVDSVRERIPGVRVIVHPECPIDVVRKADLSGSTSFIIRRIEQAPEGACFAVGTEINLVNRLNRRFPGKTVLSLSPYQNLCTTMYRNRPRWLCAILRSLENGALRNRVTVPDTIRHDARKALERMLDLS
jgi:quinolinate synthase